MILNEEEYDVLFNGIYENSFAISTDSVIENEGYDETDFYKSIHIYLGDIYFICNDEKFIEKIPEIIKNLIDKKILIEIENYLNLTDFGYEIIKFILNKIYERELYKTTFTGEIYAGWKMESSRFTYS